MKRTLLTFIVIALTSNIAFSAEAYNQMQVHNELDQSNKQHRNLCKSLRLNFKSDASFQEFLQTKCTHFEDEKYKLQPAIFRFPNKFVPDYNKNYNKLVSEFIINANKKEAEHLKEIVTEYCNYNSYLYRKKNPTACTQETINELFQTMP